MIVNNLGKGRVVLTVGKKLRENDFTKKFGILQLMIESKQVEDIYIDLSSTEWADPFPLMLIICELSNANYYKNCNIFIDLIRKDTRSNIKCCTFHKFLAAQGFLRCLNGISVILVHGNPLSDFVTFEKEIYEISEPLAYRNADCVPLKIADSSNFISSGSPNDQFIESYIEKIIETAKANGLKDWYDNNTIIKDSFHHMLNVVLFESISNSILHAYSNHEGFFGIYLRIRQGRPTQGSEVAHWKRLKAEEEAHCPCLKEQDFGPDEKYLEIFTCDAGKGLSSDIANWKLTDLAPEAKKALVKAKKSSHPLNALGKFIFSQPFSRDTRRNKHKTKLTGLQYIGSTLKSSGDRNFGRIYSNSGWIGERFPWSKTTKSISHSRLSGKTSPARGTFFSYSIPRTDIEPMLTADWVQPNIALLKQKLSEGSFALSAGVVSTYCVVDHCESISHDVPEELFGNDGWKTESSTLVWRPNKNIRKAEVSSFIKKCFGNHDIRSTRSLKRVFIVDVSRSLAISMYEIIQLEPIRKNKTAEVIIISNDWYVCHLGKYFSSHLRLRVNKNAAKIIANNRDDDFINSAFIIKLLRRMDSLLFWDRINENEKVFIDEKIAWFSAGAEITIDGYLNFLQAVIDDKRYRACQRSLLRTLTLFKDLTFLAADNLVNSFIRNRVRCDGAYRFGSEEKREVLVVGSLCVTGGTIAKCSTLPGINAIDSVSMFVHPFHKGQSMRVLDWLPGATFKYRIGNYARIPETPFVGRHGEKGIPLIRFPKPNRDSEKLDSSYYGHSPNEMYGYLDKYKLLKLGHWEYENRHDLITINLIRGVRIDKAINGDIIVWARKTINGILSSDEDCKILIYPSGPVTQRVVSLFKKNGDIDPKTTSIVPIRFLSRNRISPLRVPPVTLDLLRDMIRDYKKNSNNNKCSVVIFDDASVTGKTMRELKSIIRSIGANGVYGVVILDRTALPSEHGQMKSDKYTRYNHSFWRWDVPHLGTERICTLCSCLERTKIHAEKIGNKKISNRLREWGQMWRPQNIESGWHDSGKLGDSINIKEMKFSIDLDELGREVSHEVKHLNSTSLSSAITELTRSTPRSDYVIKKIDDEMFDVKPQTKLELLCTQLLLFYDELSYWQRLDRYKKILEIMWIDNSSGDSIYSALSGLCFSIVDPPIAEVLWSFLEEAVLPRKRNFSNDALAASYLIYIRAKDHVPNTLTGASTKTSDEIKMIRAISHEANNELYLYSALFKLIWVNDNKLHMGDLGIALKKAGNTIEKKDFRSVAYYLLDIVRKNLFVLSDTIEKLKNFSNLILATDSGLHSFEETVSECYKLIDNVKRDEDIAKIKEACNIVESEIYGSKNNNISLTKYFWSNYTYTIRIKDILAKPLVYCVHKLKTDFWEDNIINKRLSDYQSNAQANTWHADNLPEILTDEINGKEKEEFHIFFDFYIEQFCIEILSNVFWRKRKIRNPYNNVSDSMADMWYFAKYEEGFYKLKFINSCDDQFEIKMTLSNIMLSRINGSFDVSFRNINDEHCAIVEVSIPTIGHIIKGKFNDH